MVHHHTVSAQWGWFAQLVQRLALQVAHVDARSRGVPPGPTDAALDHALGQLGWATPAIRDAVAAALGVTPSTLTHPCARDHEQCDLGALAVLLPVLLRHAQSEVRGWAQRWLDVPDLLQSLPLTLLADWLGHDPNLPAGVLRELQNRGLALLGPSWLSHLRVNARSTALRQICGEWERSYTIHHAGAWPSTETSP